MGRPITMLDLVTTVARHARGDDEIVATVCQLVESGAVRLGGSFRDRPVALRLPRPSVRCERRVD